MDRVAELVALGHDVLITHGNGPAGRQPPGQERDRRRRSYRRSASTGAERRRRATIGFTVINALEHSLRAAGAVRPVAAVVTRTLVDGADPHFQAPTKPVGRFLPRDEAQLLIDFGQTWEDRGERGWRRVVASPEPVEVLDLPAVRALMAAGFVVVAAGRRRDPRGRRTRRPDRGVDAVIDKDLTAALLAAAIGGRGAPRSRPTSTTWSPGSAPRRPPR